MTRKWFALLGMMAAGPAAAQGVLTYHNSPTRHGDYTVPGLTAAAAGSMKLDTSFNGVVSGHVYAQPLYWHPKNGADSIIVATESNTVYALDPTTGAMLWQQTLLPPVTSGLGCGNINPEGVTGTPTIDAATGTLYLDAMTSNAGNLHHMMYALSLTNGAVLSGWPIDIQAVLNEAGVAFDSKYVGERSAVLTFKDKLYAVYGGRFGDCTPYNGTVVEVDPASTSVTGTWQTRATGGGIWAQGGIASDDGSLFVTTGNTINADSYGDGESVVKLKPGLARSNSNADFYAPSNWQQLDGQDLDLGGTEALPVNLAPADGKMSKRVIAFGKDGNGYLIDRSNMGGIGGKATIVKLSNSQIKTGPAVYSTAKEDMVAFTNPSPVGCSGAGIMMISLKPKGKAPITVDWCAAYSGDGSPIITTTDGTKDPIVWVTGAEGDNLLHGFDAKTGAVVFNGGGTALSGLHHFSTLIAAGGKLYVAGDNAVYAFSFTKG
jgi:outer membrane protein assembly factor BamB